MKVKSAFSRKSSALLMSMSAGLMIAQVCFASARPVKKTILLPHEEKPAKSKTVSSKKNNGSVKIYPDIIERAMHVIAKKNEGNKIDFFVFDLEGTLIQHYKMKEKDHIKINGLSKGSYVYRVFSGDEETASGNFDIR